MRGLKAAIEQQQYYLAAHYIVYGLLKTVVKENEKNKCSNAAKQRRAQRQSERKETRLLQPGS